MKLSHNNTFVTINHHSLPTYFSANLWTVHVNLDNEQLSLGEDLYISIYIYSNHALEDACRIFLPCLTNQQPVFSAP